MKWWRCPSAWLLIGLALHLPWEVAQLPLYTLWHEADSRYIAFAVAHCLAGDLLIAASTYAIAAAVLGRLDWPITKPCKGILIVVSVGVLYTAWSEWQNVYRSGSWAYTSDMPLLFGIGLSPLLQWIVVPVAASILLRCKA